MKAILITSFIFLGLLLTAPATQAHQTSTFDKQLSTAYRHSSQLDAAILWRLNHPNVDLNHNTKALLQFNWHPSVIAVISSPLFNHRFNHRPNQKSGGYRNQKRSFHQSKSQRVRKQTRRF